MKYNYDVFISYRREGGYETAKHLNDLLVRDGYRVSFDIDTLRTVKLYNVIANLLLQKGEEKDALDYLRKILNVFNNALGFNHPNTLRVKEDIASIETHLSSPTNEQPSDFVKNNEEGNSKSSFWKKLFGKK